MDRAISKQGSAQPSAPSPERGAGGILAALIAGVFRFLTGAVPRWSARLPADVPIIFYSNHTSHLDAAVLWSLLPPARRIRTRPVAAQDYWVKTAIRRYVARRIFNVVLVARSTAADHPAGGAVSHAAHDSLMEMTEALSKGESLILFPEGTRGKGETIAPFKSGLYHLALRNPHVLLVPVYLENLNRILPKGEYFFVPLICNAHFGLPLTLPEKTGKVAFLEQARQAMEDLKHP